MKNSKTFIAIYLSFISGCAQSNTETQSVEISEEPEKTIEVQTEMANPSLKKCIDDGYSLIPIKEDGIVRSYMCFNAANNKKCDSWAYYRNQCSLDAD